MPHFVGRRCLPPKRWHRFTSSRGLHVNTNRQPNVVRIQRGGLIFLVRQSNDYGQHANHHICTSKKAATTYRPQSKLLCAGGPNNQYQQFLESLLVADRLGRVMVLPPFKNWYHDRQSKIWWEFPEVFDSSTLAARAKVATVQEWKHVTGGVLNKFFRLTSHGVEKASSDTTFNKNKIKRPWPTQQGLKMKSTKGVVDVEATFKPYNDSKTIALFVVGKIQPQIKPPFDSGGTFFSTSQQTGCFNFLKLLEWRKPLCELQPSHFLIVFFNRLILFSYISINAYKYYQETLSFSLFQ